MPTASRIFAPGLLAGQVALVTGGGPRPGRGAAGRAPPPRPPRADPGPRAPGPAGRGGEGGPGGMAVAAAAAGHLEPEPLRKSPEPVWRAAARTVPLQRLGREEEHAWLVALLASPLGRALSGSTVTLDGARDNWFGPWPPPGLQGEGGEVPIEERRPRPD